MVSGGQMQLLLKRFDEIEKKLDRLIENFDFKEDEAKCPDETNGLLGKYPTYCDNPEHPDYNPAYADDKKFDPSDKLGHGLMDMAKEDEADGPDMGTVDDDSLSDDTVPNRSDNPRY